MARMGSKKRAKARNVRHGRRAKKRRTTNQRRTMRRRIERKLRGG